jgi:hypothetical protein
MTQQLKFTRRDFLKATALSGAGCFFNVSIGDSSQTIKGSRTQVTSIGGVPTFVCDGKPILIPAFETYAPRRHYFEQFAGAGTRIFGFSTNAAACDYGHSETTWVETDAWDYSQFEQRAAEVLATKLDGLLLPRVNLGTPRWWLQKHPEAMELLDDGSTLPTGNNPTLPKDRAFPSLASSIWREAIGDALLKLIKHIQQSRFGPHIFGYCLSGMHTEEFYHWACNTERLAGYSNFTVAAFRKWLLNKYKHTAALRAAWNRDDVDFDSAAIPTRQERLHKGDGIFRDIRQRNVVDFYLFWNELIPETIDYFARIIKESCGGRKVVGAFYGYMYEFAGAPEFGHNALGRYLTSPHLDFIAVTASYFNRQVGIGGDYARSPAASVRLHGKLWYHDNDAVSFRAKERLKALGFRDDNPDWTRDLTIQLNSLGYTDTAQKSRWMYQRGLGFALCNGMFQAWFDLHGGYFDDPQLMSEVRCLNDLSAKAVTRDRSSIAEILVIADEASCAWCRSRSPLLQELLLTPQNGLIRIGAPVDHILLNDLQFLNTDRYKLIVFLNCFQITTPQRHIIEQKLKRDGKHLLWCSAAGWFSEDKRSAGLCQELTGFEIFPSKGNFSSLKLNKNTPRKQPSSSLKVSEVGILENPDWTSLWTPTAAMSAAHYRQLARAAGVHIFNDQDDAFYVNSSMICLHASSDGRCEIRFPEKVELYDAIMGKSFGSGIRCWKQQFKMGETALWYWRRIGLSSTVEL